MKNIGFILIWSGASLFHQWRTALGVIWILIGALSLVRFLAGPAGPSVQEKVMGKSIGISSFIVLVAGVVLIVYQKYKKKGM